MHAGLAWGRKAKQIEILMGFGGEREQQKKHQKTPSKFHPSLLSSGRFTYTNRSALPKSKGDQPSTCSLVCQTIETWLPADFHSLSLLGSINNSSSAICLKIFYMEWLIIQVILRFLFVAKSLISTFLVPFIFRIKNLWIHFVFLLQSCPRVLSGVDAGGAVVLWMWIGSVLQLLGWWGLSNLLLAEDVSPLLELFPFLLELQRLDTSQKVFRREAVLSKRRNKKEDFQLDFKNFNHKSIFNDGPVK
jgi:hypothetical protein